MMKKRLIYWAKQLFQIALIAVVMGVVVDYWRRPNVPITGGQLPLQTLQGKNTTLAALSQDETLVLYVWGSWCGICRHSSPMVEKWHQEGMPVLGLALASGSHEDVKQYLQKHAYTFDNVNDANGQLAREWGIKATPTIIFVKQGRVVYSTTGLFSPWGIKTRWWLANWLG